MARPPHSPGPSDGIHDPPVGSGEFGLGALTELIEQSLDGVAVLDEASRVLYINPAGCEIVGRSSGELIGQTGLLAVSPERRQTARENLLQAMRDGQGRRSTRIVRPDGREREIEYTYMVLDATGRRMVASIFRDVTEARRSERWAVALARIASGAALAGSPEAILTTLAQSVVEATDLQGCAAILFDGDPPRFRVAGTWGLPGDYAQRFQEALAAGLDLPALRVFQTRQPLVIDRARQDPVLARCTAPGRALFSTSIVCVPMVARGRPAGALKMFTTVPDHDSAMLRVLGAIADQAAMAVDNAQLFAEARQSSRRQEALVQAGLALASELSPPTVLSRIVELACEVTDASYGALGVLGSDGRLDDFITTGIFGQQRDAIGDLRVGKDLLGVMINEARPLRLSGREADRRSVGFPPHHPPMTSFLGVPITVRGSVYGHLYLTEKRDAPEFTADDERAAVTLAAQAGVAIENARLFADAQARLAAEERNRLARELHDSVSQALFSMTLQTRAAQLALERGGLDPSGPLGSRLTRLRELTEGAHAEMRALIFELRPEAIREEGLIGAIRKHAGGIAARDDLPIEVEAPADHIKLPADVEEEMYRLAQEALGNVAKHAEASRAWVRLRATTAEPKELIVEIEDDGIGFDPAVPRPGHLGLDNMAQRAAKLGGTLDISSFPRKGTVIRATVPVKEPHGGSDQRPSTDSRGAR
jgi:PAS domain S-box-containing protein